VSPTAGSGVLGMRERSGEAGGRDEPDTLQSRLEDPEDDGAVGTGAASADADQAIADPVALLRHLDVSGHFHRDSRAGRVYHPGMVSLREDVPTDSLHISVDDNRVMAHVDEVSPLAEDAQGKSRYSVRRAVAHNLAGMARDLMLTLRGRQGDHRSELNCEWVAGEDGGALPKDRLLDPKTTAWSLQLEARVTGSLDEQRLRAALGAVVGRRPLQREWLEVVECEDDDDLDAARSRLHRMGVPITTFPPLHAYLARHPGGDVLMLNLNHAAADGFGAVRVLDRLARAYADPDEPPAPLDFLASHDIPVRPAATVQSIAVRSCKAATARLRDRLAPHAPLAAEEPADDPGYGFLFVGLTPEQTQYVTHLERSGPHRDVLLTALHLAIGDWNRRHAQPDRRIGVLVPVSLRPEQWREDMIGNFSVTTRLSTSRRSRASAAAALRAVSILAVRNKRTRTGIALIAGLQRAGMLALWARQSRVVLDPLTDHRRVDAAMLCNIERLDEAPSFGPEAGDLAELWFSTPARSSRILSIGAVTVAGRLQLTFRYPHQLLGREAARRFTDCYLAHVWRVAGSGA
jgi:NRPS condensation-like uncharacterized protein